LSTSVKRKRRSSQKGVQAVFTPINDWKRRAQLIVGLVAIGAGSAGWIYTTRIFDGLGLGSLVPRNESASAFLLPISIPLLIAGVGICTYYLAMRSTWRASNRIDSALYELEALVGRTNGALEPRSDSKALQETNPGKSSFHLLSRALFVALAEGVLLITIYGGLVQEYSSNINMQNWVHANFAPGAYLLSYNGVLALAGLLGVVIFQLLPKTFQSKKLQKSRI
jgi:hypothetical protein